MIAATTAISVAFSREELEGGSILFIGFS